LEIEHPIPLQFLSQAQEEEVVLVVPDLVILKIILILVRGDGMTQGLAPVLVVHPNLLPPRKEAPPGKRQIASER
jgi:hypothetical protein